MRPGGLDFQENNFEAPPTNGFGNPYFNAYDRQNYAQTPSPSERPHIEDSNYGGISTNQQSGGGGGGGGNGLLGNGMTPQNMDYKRIGNINDVQMLNQAANAAWSQNLNQMFAGTRSDLGTYGGLAGVDYGALKTAAGNTGYLAGGYLNAGASGLQSLLSSAGQYNNLISQILSGQQGQGLQNLADQYGHQANSMYNNNFGNAISQQAAGLGVYGNQLMNSRQGADLQNLANGLGQQANSMYNNNFGNALTRQAAGVGNYANQMMNNQLGQGLQNLASQYGQQANALYNNNFGAAVTQQAAKLGNYGDQMMNNQQGQAILNAAQNIGQQGNSLLGQGAVQAGMYGRNAGDIYSALGNTGNINNFVNQMTGSRGLYNTALQATKNLSPEAAANSFLSQQQGIAQLANRQADQALSGVYQSTRQQATAAADEARRQAAGQLANAGLLNTGAAVKSMTEATANPILNAETQLANTRANYLAAQQQAMGNAVGSLTGVGYSNANNALLNSAQLGLSGMGQQASQLGAAGAGMAQLAQNGLNQQNIGANLLNQQLSGLTSGVGATQAGQQLGANLLNAQLSGVNNAGQLDLQGQQLGAQLSALQQAAMNNGVNAQLQGQQLGANLLNTQQAGLTNAGQLNLQGQQLGAQLSGLQQSALNNAGQLNLQGQQLGSNLLGMQQTGLTNAGQLNMQGQQLGTQLSALQQSAYNNAVNAGLQGQQLGMNFAGQQQQLGFNAGNALAGYGEQMQNMYLNGLGNAAQGYGNLANLYGGLYGNAAGLGTQFNDAAYYTPTYARTPSFLEQLGGVLGGIAPVAAAAIYK
jgi:hypothetical protein